MMNYPSQSLSAAAQSAPADEDDDSRASLLHFVHLFSFTESAGAPCERRRMQDSAFLVLCAWIFIYK